MGPHVIKESLALHLLNQLIEIREACSLSSNNWGLQTNRNFNGSGSWHKKCFSLLWHPNSSGIYLLLSSLSVPVFHHRLSAKQYLSHTARNFSSLSFAGFEALFRRRRRILFESLSAKWPWLHCYSTSLRLRPTRSFSGGSTLLFLHLEVSNGSACLITAKESMVCRDGTWHAPIQDGSPE